MLTGHLFRADRTNIGDWHCPPTRYFAFPNNQSADILNFRVDMLDRHIVVGGGGLLAKFFHPHMQKLAERRSQLASLIAWGVGESENIAMGNNTVLPYRGKLPDYLKAFDLVGIRDYGTEYRWVPCASCMHPAFDRSYAVEHEICIYEHKRIPVPITGFPRMSNNGNDIEHALNFMGSAALVITNSYHGAYWATLLGRNVLCFANMSKMYRMKHMPVICRAEKWQRYADVTVNYPEALSECRDANQTFYKDVSAFHLSSCQESA